MSAIMPSESIAKTATIDDLHEDAQVASVVWSYYFGSPIDGVAACSRASGFLTRAMRRARYLIRD